MAATKEQEEKSPAEKYGMAEGAPYGTCADCHVPVWNGILSGSVFLCEEHIGRATWYRSGSGEKQTLSGEAPSTLAERYAQAAAHYGARFLRAVVAGDGRAAEYWAKTSDSLWDYREGAGWKQIIRELDTPVIDYQAHILGVLESSRTVLGKWADPRGYDNFLGQIRHDARFDAEAFNAALLALEKEGKLVYYRKAWWHPDDKARYQQIHQTRRVARAASTKRAGMA